MKKAYLIRIFLDDVEIEALGLGNDWSYAISIANGGLGDAKSLLSGGSSNELNTHLFIADEGSIYKAPVTIDMVESDPVVDDEGTAGGNLRTPLTLGKHISIINGVVKGAGGDEGVTGILTFVFRIEVQEAPGVNKTGPSGRTIIDLSALMKLRQKLIDERVVSLKKRLDKVQSGVLYNIVPISDEYTTLRRELLIAEGRLEEFQNRMEKISLGAEYKIAQLFADTSMFGVYSALVEGKTLSTGEKISDEDRLIEAVSVLLGFSIATKSVARSLKQARKLDNKSVVPRTAPDLLSDVEDVMRARMTSIRKSNKAYDEGIDKIAVRKSQAAHAEYDKSRGRSKNSKVFAVVDEDSDTVVFMIGTADGEYATVNFKDAVSIDILPYSQYKQFIDEAMDAHHSLPNTFYSGFNHD